MVPVRRRLPTYVARPTRCRGRHLDRRVSDTVLPRADFILQQVYANGQAIKRDYIVAYAWFDLAAGEIPKAAVLRDAVAKEMTPAQLSKARQIAGQKRKELSQKEGMKP
jgi:TPR repeat protein